MIDETLPAHADAPAGSVAFSFGDAEGVLDSVIERQWDGATIELAGALADRIASRPSCQTWKATCGA